MFLLPSVSEMPGDWLLVSMEVAPRPRPWAEAINFLTASRQIP